jgi:hypothetical protein
MIPKTFHLYWSGGPINYFRYLTFLTLRRHHPDWQIKLYTNPKHGHAEWKECSQDFHHEQWTDYTAEVYEICDSVEPWEKHQDKAPNFQSDFFRWEILRDCGGWYMDTDQIILKPFETRGFFDMVYADYNGYCPVGVIGMVKGFGFCEHMLEQIERVYTPGNYNIAGPWAMREALNSYKRIDNAHYFNSGWNFYPIPYSKYIYTMYQENIKGLCHSIDDSAYALHLFGAHPDSQAYAKMLTPEVARIRNDWICRHLRENGYV